MPSPFPGMDPYLEHPQVFPGFHNNFITYFQEALQPRLPEQYYADSGERVWIEVTERYLRPDVSVARREEPTESAEDDRGGVAVAAATRTKPVRIRVPYEEHRETFLEVYTRRDGGERLVAAIEVLSLTNKAAGQDHRGEYLRKQRELLDREVHLIEIDLLRAGAHTTAVPKDLAVEEAGPFDYHVCCHRFDEWGVFNVYPILLEEELPEIEVPLLPGDEPVPVDLQAVFARCYDAGPYRRRIRYDEDPPVPPLTPDQTEWAKKLLEPHGGSSHAP